MTDPAQLLDIIRRWERAEAITVRQVWQSDAGRVVAYAKPGSHVVSMDTEGRYHNIADDLAELLPRDQRWMIAIPEVADQPVVLVWYEQGGIGHHIRYLLPAPVAATITHKEEVMA